MNESQRNLTKNSNQHENTIANLDPKQGKGKPLTIPEVFILESLDRNDERKRRFEGQVLSDMLRLAGKNPKYYYFQSKDEIPHVLNLFEQSRYRYLHFSSHASLTHIHTTEDDILYEDFSSLFRNKLKLKRLFFSACQIGNESFFKSIATKNKGMHSIVAPAKDIRFDQAAALWSTFYISMFNENSDAMNRAQIAKRIKALTSLFSVDFFFAAYNSKHDKWEYSEIKASDND